MSFEVKESPKIKVGIFGQEYLIEEPDVDQLEALEKELNSKKGQEITVMKNLLCQLGLPLEVVGKLKKNQFLGLSEYLLSDKKKLVSEA